MSTHHEREASARALSLLDEWARIGAAAIAARTGKPIREAHIEVDRQANLVKDYVRSLERAPGWVATSEGEPPEGEYVVVWVRSGGSGPGRWDRARLMDTEYGIMWMCERAGSWRVNEVTHWMPIAAPRPTAAGEGEGR